jgi:hypothetical protein
MTNITLKNALTISESTMVEKAQNYMH